MSANIAALPASASAVAQTVSNGTSDPAAIVADWVDAHGRGAFDALFRQLLTEQDAAADANPLLPAPATTPQGDAAMAKNDLAALLPFLDALGLTQAGPAPTTVRPAVEIPVEAVAADSTQTVLAGPAGIPVAGHPAISAAATTAGTRTAPQSSAVPTCVPGNHGSGAAATDTATHALSADASQGRDAAAGRTPFPQSEFSPQFVATSTSAAPHAAQAGTAPAPQVAQAGTAPAPHVAQAVGTPGWAAEIGDRVVWMANHREGRAELVLTPPQMGRVEVSLSIRGDQAVASFASANPAVREALEAALPRLREMLADAGIQLGQTQVGAENARQSAQWAQQDKNGGNFGFDRTATSDNAALHAGSGTLPAGAALKAGRGLVDVFA